MNSIIFPLVLSALVSSTLHLWWFNTSLPVHAFKLLRNLGWRQDDITFWPEQLDYEHWYPTAFFVWLSLNDDIPALVRKGLQCPGCLSLHTSFWSIAFVSLLFICDLHPRHLLQLMLIGPLACPCIVMLMHAGIKFLNVNSITGISASHD